jgi:phosphate starvation-inducible PhoH-like protein
VTQIDLPGKNGSGLVNANMVLKNVSGIRLVKFTEKDVVRHELVKKIIQAYNIADEEKDKLV